MHVEVNGDAKSGDRPIDIFKAFFVLQLVAAEEVGRIFSLMGLGGNLSFIISYALYNNLYRLTISWRPGFLFVFIGTLQLLVFIGYLFVHFLAKRDDVQAKASRIRDHRAQVSRK